MTHRVAIYARFSTDMQRDESIEDQVRTCRARADREGWVVTEVLPDYALSGATIQRPSLQALLEGARARRFEIVLTESLDRISRDQEHIAGIWKALTFAGVKLLTVADGEVTELHVGLKGTMNALFLKDLAAKTHRGLAGRVDAGKSGGGLCYGYDVVRGVDSRGEPLRGDRMINAVQADVVRRIFTMFAVGVSPISIAKTLNAEGLTGPEGRAWRDTTIRGHAARGTGILRNELYIGTLLWNRLRFIRDPATGKRVSRLNPEAQWVRRAVPDLRIVDDELWQRVQQRLGVVRAKHGADDPDRPKFWEKRRSQHLLTGKVFCGCCGGTMTNIGRDYVACSAARKQGTCTNTRGMQRGALDKLVLEGLASRLMAPEHVAVWVEEFTAAWNRGVAEASAGREAIARELATVERKLDGIINALADGFRASGLQGQLDSLEARRIALSAKLLAPAPVLPRLHPNLAQVYREKVERLQELLQAGPDGAEALEAVRDLIERIVLTPSPDGRGFEVELLGEIAAMIRLATGDKPSAQRAREAGGLDLFSSSVKVVAGTGFEPVTFRL